MKTTHEIVNHLARYFVSDKPELNREPLSPQVEALVDQLGDFLGNQLRDNLPFREVWDGFINDPEVYATFLVVALESIFNTDRTVHQRVDHLLQKMTVAGVKTIGDGINILDIDTEPQTEDFGWFVDAEMHPIVLVSPQGDQLPESDNLVEGRRLSSALMVRKKAEIVYAPAQETKLPFMFMSLGQLMDSSDELSFENKVKIEAHLDLIHAQLSGKSPFNKKVITKEIVAISEIDSSIADGLIDILRSHIDDLSQEAGEFLINFRKF